MSPSLQTMGFFMSDINFCNTKEQLNHFGEVVTGKVDGSPTGADIGTSTLPYTGQVRKTLPALEGEYETSIANKESEADAAIDAYRLLSKGPYASGILLGNNFEFVEYDGESYFATNPPYTTTATTPDADGNLFAGNYQTLQNVQDEIKYMATISFKNEGGFSAVENMVAGRINGVNGAVTHAKGNKYSTGAGTWECLVDNANALGDFIAVGAMYASDFGADVSGTTDAKQFLRTAVSLGGELIIDGNYVVSGESEGEVILQPLSNSAIKATAGSSISMMPTSLRKCYLIACRNVENITIEDLVLTGDKDVNTSPIQDGQFHGIQLNGCRNIRVNNVKSTNFMGDGIAMGGLVGYDVNYDVRLTDCDFDGNGRQGASLIGVDYFRATNCKFTNTQGSLPECGVDIEPNPNYTPTLYVNDAVFTGCYFGGNNASGLLMDARSGDRYITNVKVVESTFEGNINRGITYLGGTEDTEISGCTFKGNGSNDIGVYIDENTNIGLNIKSCTTFNENNRSIYIDSTTESVIISGNTIRSTANNAIEARAADNLQIHGNTIHDSLGGVKLISCKNGAIKDNTFRDIEYTTIELSASQSKNTLVSGNTFTRCSYSTDTDDSNWSSWQGCPILLRSGGSSNVFSGNIFTDAVAVFPTAYYAFQDSNSRNNKSVFDAFGDPNATRIYNVNTVVSSNEVVDINTVLSTPYTATD